MIHVRFLCYRHSWLPLILLIALSLTGCAVSNLPADQPMALISQTKEVVTGSNDSPAKRLLAATALGLDGNQKQRFNSLLDMFKRQQAQLKPLVRQFQIQARTAFASPSFSAAGMQAQWQKLAGPLEARSAGEAAVQVVGFWSSLSPGQRQQAEQRFKELQARVNESIGKSLNQLRQNQAERLRAILPAIQVDLTQRTALYATVLDPAEVLARQSGIQKDIQALIQQLKTPGSNIHSLQSVLTPLYRNQRHWSTQLSKLQNLHARLNPKQRQQLLAALKQ